MSSGDPSDGGMFGTIWGHDVQELLLPISFAICSYFLGHYPTYYPAVCLGLGCLYFSPIGGIFLAPHAQKIVDFVAEVTGDTIANIIVSAGTSVVEESSGLFQPGWQYLQEQGTLALNAGTQHANLTLDRLVEIGVDSMMVAWDEMSDIVDLVVRVYEFFRDALWQTFVLPFTGAPSALVEGGVAKLREDHTPNIPIRTEEFWTGFFHSVTDAFTGDDFQQPLMGNLSMSAEYVYENSSVQEKFVHGATDSCLGLFADDQIMGEIISLATAGAQGFNDAINDYNPR